MVELWTNFALHRHSFSICIMFCENYVNAQAALDPSELLLWFQNIIVKSEKKGFDLFKQQDGSETLCIWRVMWGVT